MRTFEYRIYPHKAQSRLLMQCLIESRHLYNEMLETVKAQYAAKSTFPGTYELTSRFQGRGGEHVPASTVQTLADRLTKALKRSLAFKEVGEKAGFPRFKKPNRWHSFRTAASSHLIDSTKRCKVRGALPNSKAMASMFLRCRSESKPWT